MLCNQENKKQVNKQKQLKKEGEKLKILPMIVIPLVNQAALGVEHDDM